MKISIVLIFLFSINSAAGNPGMMLGGLDFWGLSGPTKVKSRSIHQVARELAEARWAGNAELIEELEEEMAALSDQDPRMRGIENFDIEKGKNYFTTPQKNAPVPVFVPGIWTAPTEGAAAKSSSGSESDSSKQPGVSDSLPTSEEEEDFFMRRLPSSTHNSPVKLRKRAVVPSPSASDDDASAPLVSVHGTPAVTPRDLSPVSLSARQKFYRGLQTLLNIVRNIGELRRRGATGLMLHEKHWTEACDGRHAYVGDDYGASFLRNWKGSDAAVSFHEVSIRLPSVHYMTPEERAAHRVHVQSIKGRSGRLMSPNGEPVSSGYWIGVIAPNGFIYIAEGVPGLIHHSSILSGAAVLWAFEIKTDQNGFIVRLVGKSGHYQPSKKHHLDGLSELARRGVDLSFVEFELVSADALFEPVYNALEYLQNPDSCKEL